MKVITAVEEYSKQPDDVTVFLAGGITNCPEWQNGVIEILREFDSLPEYDLDNVVIFNPRRENFPIHDKNASFEQIKWEFNKLELADIFSMYFCDADSDQPICMYELGRNIVRIQNKFPDTWTDRIIITCNTNYRRDTDVFTQTNFATSNIIYPYMVDKDDYDSYKHHAMSITSACNIIKLYRQGIRRIKLK